MGSRGDRSRSLPGLDVAGLLGFRRAQNRCESGGGVVQPLLLMVWPQGNASEAILDRMKQVAVRVGAGASVPFAVAPAAAAWREVTAQDTGRLHPSPRGAELSAAVIYVKRRLALSRSVSGSPGDGLGRTGMAWRRCPRGHHQLSPHRFQFERGILGA